MFSFLLDSLDNWGVIIPEKGMSRLLVGLSVEGFLILFHMGKS